MDIDSLINHPEWLLLVLAPLFIVCMAAEYFIGQKQGRLPDNSSYKLSEVMCNFTLAGMHQLVFFEHWEVNNPQWSPSRCVC